MNGISFTPYADIFRLLKKHPDWLFRPRNDFQHRQAAVLLHANILVWDKTNKAYVLHPKQIKPGLQVLPSPTESPVTGGLSDLGRVRVDWAGRGVNTGSYPILAEDEKSYTIDNGTDPGKPMRLRISKTRCEKVTVVVEKAA